MYRMRSSRLLRVFSLTESGSLVRGATRRDAPSLNRATVSILPRVPKSILPTVMRRVAGLRALGLLSSEAVVSAQRASRSDWAEQSRERARTLEGSVPKLTIVVDEPLSNLQLFRDGTLIQTSTWGWPVPIDPGSYEITGAAPKRRLWRTRVAIEVGSHVVLHVPSLAEEATAHAEASTALPPRNVEGASQRAVAWTLAITAAVVAGVGTYAGLTAVANNNDAAAHCPTSPQCADPRAVVYAQDAHTMATISTVSFVASGALFAAATVLFLSAPRALARVSVAIQPNILAGILAYRW